MKKIIVSGCSNCPYFTIVFKDSCMEKELNNVSHGVCRHPSFHYTLSKMAGARIDTNIFLRCGMDGNMDETINIQRTPTWCPLTNDNEEE